MHLCTPIIVEGPIRATQDVYNVLIVKKAAKSAAKRSKAAAQRKNVQIPMRLHEQLKDIAHKESKRTHRSITIGQYVTRVLAKHVKSKKRPRRVRKEKG
jgi:hypothetical protein